MIKDLCWCLGETKSVIISKSDRILPKYIPGIMPMRVNEKYCSGSRKNCKRDKKPSCIGGINKVLRNGLISGDLDLAHETNSC